MFVPLAHARYFGQVELGFNVRSTLPQDVTPTWYLRGRGAMTGPVISLAPTHVEFHPITDYLPEGVALAQVQGLELSYVGAFKGVWAQATLMPDRRAQARQSLDANFTMAVDFRSSRLEAVWASRRGDTAVVALANTANEPLIIRVASSQRSGEIRLEPQTGQDLVVQSSDRGEGADWIALRSDGPPGALRATGFVLSASDPYPRLIRFFDPAAVVQEKLFGTNHRIHTSASLAVKNTSEAPITATPEFLNPETGEVIARLEPILLPAGLGRAVRLDRLGGLSIERANIRILNTGDPGSLIGSLHAVDQATGLAFEVPLRDSGAVRGSGGAYPWRLDGDYETRVSVTNVGTTQASFVGRIRHAGGTYVLKPQILAVGESAVFDVKRLRDDQVPDAFGNTLPMDVEQGHFLWSIHGPGRLAGRGEMVNVTEHVSSSYSCGVCCPDSFYATHADPASIELNVDDTTGVDVTEELEDCYGSRYEVPRDPALAYNTNIVSIENQGEGHYSVYGVDEGQTTPNGEWDSYTFWEYPSEDCSSTGVVAEVEFQVQTRAPVLGGSGCGTVTRGNSATFTINNLSQNSQVSEWRYENSYGNVIRQTNTGASSWSGTLIIGGTGKAKVNTQAREFNLQCQPVVNSRSGWAWSAYSPTKVANGTFISLANPPSSSSPALGYSSLDFGASFMVGTVQDGGPNHGLKWVTELNQSYQGTPNRYRWQITEELDSTSAQFYRRQCGQSGFISGSVLRSNVVEHESGTASGHYKQFSDALNTGTNNLGAFAEPYLGTLTTSQNDFANAVTNELLQRRDAVLSATAPEPGCNPTAEYDTACQYRGNINWPPYDPACPDDTNGEAHESRSSFLSVSRDVALFVAEARTLFSRPQPADVRRSLRTDQRRVLR
jgi:hypothetical protein